MQLALSPSPSPRSGPASVAIDLGSYTIRICIAGTEGKPDVITRCPNALVWPSQKRYSGSAGKGLLAGPQIALHCTNYGSLSIRQPMDRGMIVDWPTQKLILDAALVDALSRENPGCKVSQRLLEGREVIFTEAYLNLPDLQAGLDVLFLEGYGASKIWRSAREFHCLSPRKGAVIDPSLTAALLIPYQPSLFTSKAAGKKRSRPECMCIIDLGHNATHIVPVMGDTIVWSAVRRHVVSQRILTNLLKETLSFRQWDMMDEPWLVGHIKERCCFVASKAGRRGDATKMEMDPPSTWSYAGMIEACQNLPPRKNPIIVDYVLPNYSASSKETLGYVRGRRDANWAFEDLDSFIAGSIIFNSEGAQKRETFQEDDVEDNDEEDESDDDFREVSPAQPAPRRQEQKQRQKQKQKQPKENKAAVDEGQKNEETEEQVLVLERERFQIPEVMFDPGIIGLEDAPLHQVVEGSIKACDKDLQDLFWANIVLVGGGAKLVGLKQRLCVLFSQRADIVIALMPLPADSMNCDHWQRQMCLCKCG